MSVFCTEYNFGFDRIQKFYKDSDVTRGYEVNVNSEHHNNEHIK